MLYVPPAFKFDDAPAMLDHIDQVDFAMVALNSASGPSISHVPLMLDRDRGANGTLIGHIARANPQWQTADTATSGVAVFPGPDAYITPSWYPSKRQHGRVVPTWNYTVVHARGPVRFVDDAEFLRDVVTRLTKKLESRRDAPWAVTDAPERFIDSQLRGIIGIELTVADLEGKRKLSQNRDPADRAGVVEGLSAEQDTGSTAIAQLVSRALDDAG